MFKEAAYRNKEKLNCFVGVILVIMAPIFTAVTTVAGICIYILCENIFLAVVRLSVWVFPDKLLSPLPSYTVY